MVNSKKKGFTVIELVIVIAVIAVLAAVLIPTFSSLIKKTKIAADIQTVRNLNTIVASEGAAVGGIKTAHDAIVAASNNGYDVTHISPTADGRTIAWDGDNSRFILLDNKELVFPSDKEISKANTFIVSDIYPAEGYEEYAVYLKEGFTGTELEVSTGLDVGYNEGIESITYNGNKNVIVRSNTKTGTVIVDNPDANVDWYGITYTLEVRDAAMNSVYVFGKVLSKLMITKGSVVVESGSDIATIYVIAENESDYKLKVKNGAKIGLITANKSGMLGNIDVPENVHTLDYKEGAVAYSTTTGETYTTFKDAFSDTKNGETLFVLQNTSVDENSIKVTKEITIDLVGNTLSAALYYGFSMDSNNADITIKNGTINSTYCIGTGGKGKMTLENVQLKVTGDVGFYNSGYVLTINESSVIEQTCNQATIFVQNIASVNVYGTINTLGRAFQNNGKNKTDNTIINIYDGAEITGGSCIAYLPAPTTFNVYGGTMNANSGIGMKSGNLNIYGGTIHATGANDKAEGIVPESVSGGMYFNGSVIQIDSNTGYAGNMRINITGGTLTSDNSYIICETGNVENATNIVSLHIGDGTFSSKYSNILLTTAAEENIIIDIDGISKYNE